MRHKTENFLSHSVLACAQSLVIFCRFLQNWQQHFNVCPHQSYLNPFLPRDATHSTVMPQYIVCLSVRPSVCLFVCPSVTIMYRDHIAWNSSKIISRLNTLRLMPGLTPTWAIQCKGNTLKLGWNMGRVTQENKKSAISPKRCKIGPRLL